MITRSVKNISIREFPFDVSKLTKFDQSYSKKVDLRGPDHNNFMVHINKILAESYKERFRDELSKIMHICWDQVFTKTQKSEEKILTMIGKPMTKENSQFILKIANLETDLYYKVR
jgi:hypothetical protein